MIGVYSLRMMSATKSAMVKIRWIITVTVVGMALTVVVRILLTG